MGDRVSTVLSEHSELYRRDMNKLKRFVAMGASVGLATTALVLAAPPAAQAQGVGSGQAVIRLDAPTATVTKTGKNSYRMFLPEGTTGQWMGERPDAQGKSKVLVGDITAKKLSNRWGNFRYTKSGAYATLVWNNLAPEVSSAVVKLSEPKMTDKGVRFDFTSRSAIPKTMSDVTLNIARAAGAKVRGTTYTATIADALTTSLEVVDPNGQVKARIYNVGNNNTCWGVATINGHQSVAVNTNTCDNIPYTNWVTGGVTYGVSTQFPCGPPDCRPGTNQGSALFNLKISPPGQDSYQWTHSYIWTN